MAASEELVLLPREQGDTKMTYLAVIPLAQRSSSPEAVPMATFTLVVASSRCGVADVMKRAVRCNIPVGELRARDGAAVDGVIQFLVAKISHPALRQEVGEEANKAVAHVRGTTRFAAEGEEELVDVEFWLVVILDDSSESAEPGLCQEEEEEEEVGSDLESDEACWQRGASDGDHWQHAQDVHHDDDAVLGGGDAEDGQFAARHYEGREEEGGPSTATLLMGGLELHMDDPEFDVRSEVTARDARHLMRLAQRGGNFTSDPAFKRAFDANTSVTPVPLTEVLKQTLERIMPRSTSPVPRIMRTGF